MIKEKRILSYFICWLFLGFIVCFVGITKTYAATTTTYENIGYLNDVTILYSLSDDPPYPIEIPRNGEYQLYNVEKIIVQIDNYTFSGGTTYNLELSLPITTLNNNMYSVIDENGNKCSIGTTDASGSSFPNYSFNCTKNTNSLTLNIYNTDGSDILNAGIFRWNYIYLRKQLTTTDTSILENQNQQIIQGQDEIKDTIKDELNSCRQSVNLFDKNNANIITVHLNSINTISYSPSNRSIYIPIKPNTTYTISRGEIGLPFVVGTTENIPSADSTYYNRASNEKASSLTITSNSNSNYLIVWYWNGNSIFTEQELLNTLQIQKGSVATKYEPYGEEICTNKIDETNNQLGDLNNSLNDSNVDGSLGSAGSFFDNFSTTDHGGLSGIITSPLVAINQMLNTSCSPMSTTFKGKNLSLPCGYDFWNRLGAIQDFINIVLGGMLCYRIIIKLYKLIERIKNPEDDRLEVMDL